MGEVYKARDTRLERTVAIKVLPVHFADNPDLRQRFEREAKTISSLNHPNICTLFDVGQQDGADFLVMEHLEGESLLDRLKKGPLPLGQAMKHAVEIADALDKAHRHGVVHRDLKPGNVMLTKAGAKLLDFGLAKMTAPESSGGLSALATAERPLTEAGTVLGTFQYMAPEQLEGREADARSDVFAFGAVLYEMVTGRKAFEGKSQASLISAIMGSEPPPLSAVVPMTPPALERVVRTCLAKDPDDRWQSAHDVAAELRWISEAGSQAGVPAPVVARRRKRERWAWLLAGVLGLVGAAAAGALVARGTRPRFTTRFVVPLPKDLTGMNWPRLSPDGRTLAFQGVDTSGKTQIWLRPLGAFDAYLLAGTDGAGRPFWSPDSLYLAFFVGDQLKKVPASGGPAQLIAADVQGSDGSWGSKNVILFDNAATDPIKKVSASAGVPTVAVGPVPPEVGVGWPAFLPDGVHFLMLGILPRGEYSLKIASTESSETRVLLDRIESLAEYAPSGHILYVSQGTLLARPFSTRKLAFTGDPVPVGEKVASEGERANFSVSDTGALVSMLGSGTAASRLVFVDRAGKELASVGEPAIYRDVALSPDGSRVAYGLFDPRAGTDDLWIRDLKRDVASRLTFDPTNEIWPVWSPDGSRIAYSSDRAGTFAIVQKVANGAGEEQPVFKEEGSNLAPCEWLRDGQTLLFQSTPGSNWDLRLLPPGGSAKPTTVLASQFNEAAARLSPDGRFVAYQSNESGQFEIYIQSLPPSGSKWQVSTNSGFTPQWRGDGRELFFRDLDGFLNAVPVGASASLELGQAHRLFHAAIQLAGIRRERWAVSADGQRFLLNTPTEADTPPAFNVVLDWTAELGPK
jgi:eukaryotic-like serine/threonine-protein kinase